MGVMTQGEKIREKISHAWVIGWSYAALFIEKLWNSVWPLTTALLLFAAACFFNLPFYFGQTGQLIFLGVWLVVFIAAAARFAFLFKLPGRAETERRIETASGLAHRPMEALRDRPAEIADAEGYILWAKHLQSARKAQRDIKVPAPRFTVAAQDRFVLRHAALLLFVIGLVVARHDALPRLAQTLTPDIAATFQTADAAMDIWIEAPEYTGVAPVFLSSTKSAVPVAADAVRMPAGSVLKLRLAGYRFAPAVRMADDKIKLSKQSPGNYIAEAALTETGKLAVRPLFGTSRVWNVTVVPDTPPTIALDLTGTNGRGGLRISYRAGDDYGIKRLTANIVATDGSGSKTFDIPPAVNADAQALQTHTEDLTDSPMAGSVATMTLVAEDNAGNITQSAPHRFTLPERNFTNPIAEALVFERKRLIYYNNPITRRLSADAIVGIVVRPSNYKGDPIVFMGLSIAAKRLIYDGRDEAVATVQKLLWDIATRIEDGGLSAASRDLADALQKFSSALQDKKSTPAEIENLLDEVRKKMREYVETLASEMQQRMEQNKGSYTVSPEMAAKLMQHIDMNKVIEQMRALAEGGSRDQMQKMAEMLRKNIENLDLGKMEQMRAAQQQALQAMEEMQELIKKQQSLMDRTGKMGEDPGDIAAAAAEQSTLRRSLGDIARRLAEVMPELPENIAKADQAMKAAEEALKGNAPQAAKPHQKEALNQLQQGADDMLQQIAKGMEQMMMSFGLGGQGSGNYGGEYDPLGREQGSASNSDVKIPDEQERRRVQEIIQELRKRSNDYQRPKVERDYLDRLLDTFN